LRESQGGECLDPCSPPFFYSVQPQLAGTSPDVSAGTFIERAKQLIVDVIGISALLT
jgi:hypothetical protein